MLVVVSVIAGVPYFLAGDDARRPGYPEQLTRLELPLGVALSDLVEVRVDKVLDGDTIDVIVSQTGRGARIRYYGVDTPEAGDRCYREALDRNESLLGDTVLLLPDARDEDRFERSLRYAFRPDGVSIDATLIAEGYAHAWREDGQYRDELLAIEREAQAQGRGCLWK
jgi:endonuclease YncB( thermonuclease family)